MFQFFPSPGSATRRPRLGIKKDSIDYIGLSKTIIHNVDYRLKLVFATVSPKCRGAGPIGAGTPSNAQFFGVRY